jgi:glycosyltransferase involved in cell wall biosynthesis
LEIARVEWAELGWPASLRKFRQQLENPGNTCFILQYTALAWSRRGFPLRVLRLAQLLKRLKSRCVVVFHDPEAYRGTRWADILRRKVQLFVMQRLLRLADIAIFTLPREKISWIPANAKNVVFIPVGANLPNPEQSWTQPRNSKGGAPGVAIFSVTGSTAESQEVAVITEAVAYAAKQVGPVRLAVFGRNSETAGESLKTKLSGCPVEVSVLGLIPAEEIVRVMGACDALLFVRGPISSMRGSAIAGIACGLPVIAREGAQTAPPITDAGVVLFPTDANDFGPALARVLSDRAYNAMLSERSRNAQRLYFSWSAIAARYAEALRKM